LFYGTRAHDIQHVLVCQGDNFRDLLPDLGRCFRCPFAEFGI
jgi:hypothetical protein